MLRKWLLFCAGVAVLGFGAATGSAAYADNIKRGGTLTVARLEEPAFNAIRNRRPPKTFVTWY